MNQVVRIPRYHWDESIGRYVLEEVFSYYSERYKKRVSITIPYTSDGATGAFDILSAAWWVHDWMCDGHGWDDGTQPTRWEASQVLHDILKDEGYWARAEYWRLATYWLGAKNLKKD